MTTCVRCFQRIEQGRLCQSCFMIDLTEQQIAKDKHLEGLQHRLSAYPGLVRALESVRNMEAPDSAVGIVGKV